MSKDITIGDEDKLMATYERISEYDESQCWIQYQERLKCYFEANDITDDGKQRAILLSCLWCYMLYTYQKSGIPSKTCGKNFFAVV